MIHGDEFGRPDWILMVLGPPLAGAAIGLLATIRRRRAGLAGIAGAVGGTLGAWLGIVIYRWVLDQVIGGRDIGIFAAIFFGCFLLGAFAAAWLASAANSDANIAARPRVSTAGCGFLLACGIVTAFGVCLYLAAAEPSAFIPMGDDVKYLGIACIFSGCATLATGLAVIGKNA